MTASGETRAELSAQYWNRVPGRPGLRVYRTRYTQVWELHGSRSCTDRLRQGAMTCVLGHRRIIMGRARAEASAEVVVRMVVSEESEKARAQPGNELELSGMDRKQEVSVTVADASDPANDFPFARALGM